MKKVLLFGVCLVLSACASRPTANTSSSDNTAAVTTQADVDRAKAKFPGLTLAKLESGRMSYEADCQTCHALKDPNDFSEDHISTIVPIMAKKANDKAGRTVVDLEEQDLIMKYMIAISMR